MIGKSKEYSDCVARLNRNTLFARLIAIIYFLKMYLPFQLTMNSACNSKGYSYYASSLYHDRLNIWGKYFLYPETIAVSPAAQICALGVLYDENRTLELHDHSCFGTVDRLRHLYFA